MTARAAATRVELLRTRRLLERVQQGAMLLRRKREALVRTLVPLARPVAEQRRVIDEAAAAAYEAELAALSLHGEATLAATGLPTRQLELDLEIERVWGVLVPGLRDLPTWARGLATRATAPGTTGPALFEAANRFEALAAHLLDAIGREINVRALGAALARTSRQLHTLEQRLAPELIARVAVITRALAERDREDQTRLRNLRRHA
ncbi:MAG: V-type ATP synthase subunit D [Myxococcales bacterium]|nr:V-type ATP synthase subunit D [Myxococcales bacterium]